MRHGVVVTKHRDWNTKQVWNKGHLMVTYRRQPKRIRFRSRMVNDANQDLCGGWSMSDSGFADDQDRILDRVARGLKPAGVLYYDSEEEANIVSQVAKEKAGLLAKVVKTEIEFSVFVATKGTLEELFDLDALSDDYVDSGAVSEDVMQSEMEEFADRQLISFSEGWDVEDVPPWVTGLILGYPVENTISLYLEGRV